MIGRQVREARKAAGLTVAELAGRAGVSPRTLQRIEASGDDAPGAVVAALAAPGASLVVAASQDAPGIDPRRLPRPYDGPAFSSEHLPASNTQWGALSPWDKRPCDAGWQRVPGCVRIVAASIPAPVPFVAPAWAGWRGQLTESGRVYDYESGHRMSPMGVAQPSRAMGRALAKGEKRKLAR